MIRTAAIVNNMFFSFPFVLEPLPAGASAPANNDLPFGATKPR